MSQLPSVFELHDERFHELNGPSSSLELLLEHDEYPFAHEAGVYLPSTNEIFVTSNQFFKSSGQRCIQISKISVGDGSKKVTREEISSDDVPMANGGINYKDGILFCAQGTETKPSGLYYMSATPPYTSTLLIFSFYRRAFNSLNDVAIHSDGSIWFTNPIYGYEQGFRPKPELPNQVYRYDPMSKGIRAMADGFGRPNGIVFSPDEKMVYITDTDWIHGDGSTDEMRSSTIYAFDVHYYSGQPFMTNRRLFAMTANGIPDATKCDMKRNVYSGCGDGINVWCPGGVLLGITKVKGGAANFCFGREGSLYILNEHRICKVQLQSRYEEHC